MLSIIIAVLVTVGAYIAYYAYTTTVKACSATEENNRPVLNVPADASDKLVIVFGWGGAQLRHLRRILEAYEAQKHTTLAFTAPMSIFLDQGISPQVILHMLDTLHNHIATLPQEKRDKLRIYIHAHSNTGAITFACLCHVLRNTPKLSPNSPDFSYLLAMMGGVIYDSCPMIVAIRTTVKVPQDYLDIFRNGEKGANDNAIIAPPPNAKDMHFAINERYEQTNLPQVFVIHAFHMSLAVVSTILKANRYFHWFWTPAVTITISLIYARLAIVRVTRQLLANMGFLKQEEVSTIYSFFPESFIEYNRDFFASPLPPTDHSFALTPTNAQANAARTSYPDTRLVLPFFDVVANKVHRPLITNYLFLYSDKDKLITDRDIERTMYVTLCRGATVRQHKFKGSHHVQHFLKHPEEYKRHLFAYIDATYEEVMASHTSAVLGPGDDDVVDTPAETDGECANDGMEAEVVMFDGEMSPVAVTAVDTDAEEDKKTTNVEEVSVMGKDVQPAVVSVAGADMLVQ